MRAPRTALEFSLDPAVLAAFLEAAGPDVVLAGRDDAGWSPLDREALVACIRVGDHAAFLPLSGDLLVMAPKSTGAMVGRRLRLLLARADS